MGARSYRTSRVEMHLRPRAIAMEAGTTKVIQLVKGFNIVQRNGLGLHRDALVGRKPLHQEEENASRHLLCGRVSMTDR